MKLPHTRAMIHAAINGGLDGVEMRVDPVFGLQVPASCEGVPDRVWDVRSTWSNPEAYDRAALDLAQRFENNFKKFAESATDDMKRGALRVSEVTGVLKD